MAKFAIEIKEVHAETVIVEAKSVYEAINKVEMYNQTKGFDLDEITDFEILPSPYADVNGKATKSQLKDCVLLDAS